MTAAKQARVTKATPRHTASSATTSAKATTDTKTKTKAKRASPLKDPEGGLTAAGRRAFNARDGSHLKPGVRGEADTPDKMRRKGSFLRRHFTTLRGPLVDDDGEPTRLALSAHAWGEPVPKTKAAAKRLADKGTRLLEKYQRSKEG